jgi:hypothetical protein
LKAILGVLWIKFVPWLMHQGDFCCFYAEEKQEMFFPINGGVCPG